VAVSDDQYVTVGEFGTVLRRGSNGWSSDKRVTDQNLHAAWIDPTGGMWAVGGHYDTPPMRDGVLIHRGDPVPASFP
jgi:hypothetical protein